MALSEYFAKQRFSGREEDYAKFRPGYPEELLPVLLQDLSVSRDLVAVDVGAGTAISSAFLAKHGISVIAIEPNDEMRERGRQTAIPGIEFLKGSAEKTGLKENSADLITAFQAFHWFNPALALAEFHRILRPFGKVGLVWNLRNQDDRFTQEYSAIIDRYADPSISKALQSKQDAGSILSESPLFHNTSRVLIPSCQRFGFDALLGRVRSVSYLPRSGPTYEKIASEMKNLFEKFNKFGEVQIVYDTIAIVAIRSQAAVAKDLT